MTQLAYEVRDTAHAVVDSGFSDRAPESLSYASRSTGRKPRPRSLISALICLAFAILLLAFSGTFLIGAVLVEQMHNTLNRDFRQAIEAISCIFAFGCFGGAALMGIMGLRWLPRSVD